MRHRIHLFSCCLIFLISLTVFAQELPPSCDLIPNAGDYTWGYGAGIELEVGICFAYDIQGCVEGSSCSAIAGPIEGMFEVMYLPEEIDLAPTMCELNGNSQVVAQNRLGDRSLTCGYEWDYGEASYCGVMIIIEGENALSIQACSDTNPQPDPIETARLLMGSDASSVTGTSESSPLPNFSSQFADGFPEPPEDYEPQPAITACDGIDDDAQARCLAQLASASQDFTFCFAAVDVYACGEALMTEVGDGCETQTNVSPSECYLALASEAGIEAACERLPTAEQASCFVIAISTSGDYSVLERRFPDVEDRDFAIALVAVNRYDPALLEDIEDNLSYDMAKVYMIAPMGINGGIVYDASYCDQLRGNYGGEYAEDYVISYDLCLYFVDKIQLYSELETDEERDIFETELSEEIARIEAELDGSLDD